nr:non-oxidative hydroxyarylic acid decarboxylases subunit D [Alicyclobacillus hesperidum]
MLCPRCESESIDVVAKSPVAGCWEVFFCLTCKFTWRSSEPRSIVDPVQYHPAFKVRWEDIEHAIIVPAIPERSSKSVSRQ